MNKRILKRHKRHVARAKHRVRLSEPDLRTPEQVTAARKASQPVGGWRAPNAQYVNAPTRTNSGPIVKSAPPADG